MPEFYDKYVRTLPFMPPKDQVNHPPASAEDARAAYAQLLADRKRGGAEPAQQPVAPSQRDSRA